ncbi:xylulokinase [Kineosphaera limosa]|uniref:Xylulose kinase n=1 Tax=Kineosphaera limosa NBRC 100340 TaxID=1184609 RepID=K6W5R5_9MICO|nr:xylulokinase [Kineosphaera limosa]NYE03178.1 xylulokinase [Kineosphaera limosa]GAB94515.1 xylulokinase [Kineosphaera limosa NBRC 100340]
MSQSLVAGVDSSTQSTKIVVCDAETGAVVRSGRAGHPDATAVDPQRWWEAFEQAGADGLLEGVEAIAVGGQQHGMVAMDADGRVLHDALLWNDTRSAKETTDLTSELGGPQAWVDAVGLVPGTSFTLTKLRWLRDHEPEVAEQVADVVLPHDWLTGRILADGGARPSQWVTDRGDASGTLYFSASSNEYRTDLLELGLGRVCGVPRVAAPSEIVGRTASGMIVGPGTGDNMGAALGLGLGAGQAVVSLGTSGTVFAVSDTPPADPSGAIAGFADATGRQLPLMCTLNAARVLVAAATMLRVELDELSRLALAAQPGAGGLSLLPYLDGERTPALPQATGTLGGLSRTNATPQNLARAAVEGMLCNLADGVDALRQQGSPVEKVLLIGGAAMSPAVRAVAADLFGVPVAVPAAGEYVGIGAARQAAWALSGADAPPQWERTIEAETEPGNAEASAELRERYAALRVGLHG